MTKKEFNQMLDKVVKELHKRYPKEYPNDPDKVEQYRRLVEQYYTELVNGVGMEVQ